MSIKVSGGDEEGGIVIGNAYDKYGSQNPIVRWMMAGFQSALSKFVEFANPETINEIGCGEGYWVLRWNKLGIKARGRDFSTKVIKLAQVNAVSCGLNEDLFQTRSIYELQPNKDKASLIVCCEVLEHLEHPEAGLRALQGVVEQYLIVSVPREPLWRFLNIARGRYLTRGGNTPGHIQHWSKRSFQEMVSKYFQVIEVKSPLPWTMILCQPYIKEN